MANATFSELYTGLKIPNYDYASLVETDADTETITFRMGGVSGNIVAVLVINYTSADKNTLSSWYVTIS
jgi:hypothetical protein